MGNEEKGDEKKEGRRHGIVVAIVIIGTAVRHENLNEYGASERASWSTRREARTWHT
jgi:hypothetical protein